MERERDFEEEHRGRGKIRNKQRKLRPAKRDFDVKAKWSEGRCTWISSPFLAAFGEVSSEGAGLATSHSVPKAA